MSISIFSSLELGKKMVGGRKTNTSKIAHFNGVLGSSDDKVNCIYCTSPAASMVIFIRLFEVAT